MGLITIAKAQQNPVLATVDEDTLQELINAASRYIERYCDRKFEATSVEDILDGNDMQYIYVNNTYVTALTSVKVVKSDSTESTLDVDSFVINNSEDSARIAFASYSTETEYNYFPRGRRNIKITYTYGYDPIPADVQEACLMIVYSLYGSNSNKTNPNLDSERLGEYSYKIGSSNGSTSGGAANATGPNLMTNEAADILASYRRMVF